MTSSYLFLNSLRMHYLYWGLENDGPAIILLHGLASNARIWELTAPSLAADGFRALALEARGHGLSDKPERDYSFERLCQDLAGFIEACRTERPILVGHSWGAGIALDYAARFPVGPSAPAGIVLVDGGITQLDDLPGATWETVQERLTPPRLAGMRVEDFLARVREMNAFWEPGDEVLSIILANFEIGEDETITPRLTLENHLQIVREMWEFRTYERYQLVRCPAMAIPARPGDTRNQQELEFLELKERGVERARQIMPGLQVHWMENTIHDIPLQRPRELAEQIVRFARSVEPSR
jgi:pimeloyl-ACP methyl ester carboxylesterase